MVVVIMADLHEALRAAVDLAQHPAAVMASVAAMRRIAAVLIVSVIQRSKEIGILRAMGTSRGQILRVLLLQ